MWTWLPVDKNRQKATQALSKKDENIKHVVSTTCRPRVPNSPFQGLSEYTHIPLAPEHSVGTNEATMAATPRKPTELAQFSTSPRDMAVWDDEAATTCNINPSAIVLTRATQLLRHSHGGKTGANLRIPLVVTRKCQYTYLTRPRPWRKACPARMCEKQLSRKRSMPGLHSRYHVAATDNEACKLTTAALFPFRIGFLE